MFLFIFFFFFFSNLFFVGNKKIRLFHLTITTVVNLLKGGKVSICWLSSFQMVTFFVMGEAQKGDVLSKTFLSFFLDFPSLQIHHHFLVKSAQSIKSSMQAYGCL